jgi:tetratricopeptide (TPR) repeat protein
MKTVGWGVAGLVFALSVTAASANTARISGKVKDQEGKPVAGAVVTVENATLTNLVYTQTTAKDGSFQMPSVPYNEQAKTWRVKVEAEGYVPTRIHMESRNSGKTLIGDIVDQPLAPNAGPFELRFVAFGTVRIDYEVGPKPAETPAAADAGPGGAPAGASGGAFAEGATLAAAGKLEEALPLLQKGLAETPGDVEKLDYLARIQLKLERPDEALKYARRAAVAAPERLEGQLLLGRLLAINGKGSEAWTAVQAAQAIDPKDKRVLELAAGVAAQNGDEAAALQAYQALVEADPKNNQAWMALGGLYAKRGERDKSEQAYRKVSELDPANAHKTFYNIGVLIEKKPDLTDEDTRRAIEAYRKSIEVKPDYAPAHRSLGYALIRLGEVGEAKKELARYVELEPRAKDAAEVKSIVAGLP